MPSDWAFVSVDMELTNKCNSDCLMCLRDSIARPNGMMPEDIFRSVSDKLVNEGSLITFSGMGDPLSHPNVFEWIRDIRRKGGDVGIVINPASLNKNVSQKLIEPCQIPSHFPFQAYEKRFLKDSMHFPVCGQCDEPLRQCQAPQGLPPAGRKERTSFFRSVRLKQSYNYRSQAGAWERGGDRAWE